MRSDSKRATSACGTINWQLLLWIQVTETRIDDGRDQYDQFSIRMKWLAFREVSNRQWAQVCAVIASPAFLAVTSVGDFDYHRNMPTTPNLYSVFKG